MTTPTIPDYDSDAFELARAQGLEIKSNGFWVLLSLANLHSTSPALSNSDRFRSFENLIFHVQRCIGAGCEPRVRPLPGQDGLGASLAAPAEADQVEDTMAASIVERANDEPGLESLKEFVGRPKFLVMTRRAPVGVYKMVKFAHCRIRMTDRQGEYGIEHYRHALPDDASRLRLSCVCGGFVISRLHLDAPWEVVTDGSSFA